MAGLSTRITDSNKKFNPHLHIRKHADEDFLCTQQYFHRKSSSYLSPIHQDVTPTKMSPSPTPSPKPLSFLAPPPIRSKSASRTAYQIPKSNTITQTPTPKASKKSNSNTTAHKSPKQTPQKDNPKQSIKPHQLENIPPKQPSKSNKHPPQSPSETIHPKTQGRFPSNASAFHSKRRRVCFQTQRRFT